MPLKSHGITANTVENLMFSAGAIYKNLIYDGDYALTEDTTITAQKIYYTRTGDTPNFVYTAVVTPVVEDIATYYERTNEHWTGTVLGATNGGITTNIAPSYTDVEIDGATVVVRGGKVKTGEAATMQSSMTEFSESLVKDALHLVEDTASAITGYKKYVSKRALEDTDYLNNIAYVGTLVSGEQIIIIFPNALCTSAFEVKGQNKTQATYSITFECTATFAQDDLEHLPYEIHWPQAVA